MIPLNTPVIALEKIARMRRFPDDKINSVTLAAAIEIARTALATVEAIERVSRIPQDTEQ